HVDYVIAVFPPVADRILYIVEDDRFVVGPEDEDHFEPACSLNGYIERSTRRNFRQVELQEDRLPVSRNEIRFVPGGAEGRHLFGASRGDRADLPDVLELQVVDVDDVPPVLKPIRYRFV